MSDYSSFAKPKTVAKKTIWVCPKGSLFFEQSRSLVLCDLHLGKAAHFRKEGLAVQADVHKVDYENMERLIRLYDVKRLIINGDLFHAHKNTEQNRFKEWLREQDLEECILVKGNHDILSDKLYLDLGVTEVVFTYKLEDSFRLVHDPNDIIKNQKFNEASFWICGHVHPAVQLKGMGKMRERLAANIYFSSTKMILQMAFGEFTGIYVIKDLAVNQLDVLGEKALWLEVANKWEEKLS